MGEASKDGEKQEGGHLGRLRGFTAWEKEEEEEKEKEKKKAATSPLHNTPSKLDLMQQKMQEQKAQLARRKAVKEKARAKAKATEKPT